MKKYLYTVFSGALISTFAFSQGSIPNGNFESWTSATFEVPQYYPFTTNPEVFYTCNGAPFNVVKSTDAFHGTYSVEITTVTNAFGDTCLGGFTNTSNPNNNFPNWPGGIPYNQIPTGMRGYYKCAIPAGDTARVLVIFKQGGSSIGFYTASIYGTQSSYTLFSTTFTPPLAVTPDSIILVAISSDVFNGIQMAGSMLKLDSVSFTGVASQPAMMDGSFELWQNQTVSRADDWNYETDWQAVSQTNDAAAGNFAIELITYEGEDQNGNPKAQRSMISNGWWDDSCSCWMGGYPFSNQIDTLAFSYKYSPANPTDSALVTMSFRKNGSILMNTGILLGTAANYQYAELPFNIGTAPDSVIIILQSSDWDDSLLTSVGDDFKIDEIHFKTQPLNTSVPMFSVQNSISIYPNPSSGEFTVQSSVYNIQNVEVYNAVGEKVVAKNMNSKSGTLNLNGDGIYFVKMTSNGKTFTKKLVVSK